MESEQGSETYRFYASVSFDELTSERFAEDYVPRGNRIRLSEKFLSFYEETIDAQHFFFYIILLN